MNLIKTGGAYPFAHATLYIVNIVILCKLVVIIIIIIAQNMHVSLYNNTDSWFATGELFLRQL